MISFFINAQLEIMCECIQLDAQTDEDESVYDFLFLVLEESMNISIKNLGGEDTVGLLRGMIAVPEHVLSVVLARGGIVESVAQDAHLYVPCATATLVPHFKPYISKHHSRYNLIGKMKREGIRSPIITVCLPY